MWRHHRYWHSPAPHPILHRAIPPMTAQSQAAVFQTMLGRPELSFLGQHQVLRQRILPAMVAAEVATAAGAMLREDASSDIALGSFGCVWGTRRSLEGNAQLHTTVQRDNGRVVVSCGTQEVLGGVLGRGQVGKMHPALYGTAHLCSCRVLCGSHGAIVLLCAGLGENEGLRSSCVHD